jgi:hypothetical protein
MRIALKGLLIGGLLVLTTCKKSSKNQSGLDYYGQDSQEGTLTFSARAEFVSPDPRISSNVRNYILNYQVKYLFGSLKEHPGSEEDGVHNFIQTPGVPKTSHKITLKYTGSEPLPDGSTRHYWDYEFIDKVAFSKSYLKTGEKTLKLRLPKNPGYMAGGVSSPAFIQGIVGDKNACTDDHYPSEGDYWYFWNPYKEGCPKAVMDETIVVDAKIVPDASTSLTYPEYARLEEDGVLDITYVVGPDESKEKADDLGRAAFQKTFDILTKGKKVLARDLDPKIKLSPGTRSFLTNLYAKNDIAFTALEDSADAKVLYAFRDGKTIMVQMFFIDSKKESADFYGVVRDAILSSDVFLYDGHSGLGGNLPVSRLYLDNEPKFLKNKYQILFFNGCSTYAYYNEQYFNQKRTAENQSGTKNLDIVTTSIGAPWDVGADIDSIFILSLTAGSRPSWQKIMDDIFYVDPRKTALTQVNGDEDNPTSLDSN